MAHKYLGAAFDIHGGGIDLIFPHHENEIAQAKAFGDDFAAYWTHNAWVTMSGEKMSKSLGNSLLVSEMVKRWRPIVLRYYLGTPHYRSMIEYSEDALREAESAFARIEGFIQRVVEKAGAVEPAAEVPPAFAEAMDDDLGVPQALAIVHTTVRQGNSALTADDKEAAVAWLAGFACDARGARSGPARRALVRRRHGPRRRPPRRRGLAGPSRPRTAPGRPLPQGLRHRRRHPRSAPAVRTRHRGHPLGPALVAVLTSAPRLVGHPDSLRTVAAGDTQSIRTYPLHVARRREQ